MSEKITKSQTVPTFNTTSGGKPTGRKRGSEVVEKGISRTLGGRRTKELKKEE